MIVSTLDSRCVIRVKNGYQRGRIRAGSLLRRLLQKPSPTLGNENEGRDK